MHLEQSKQVLKESLLFRELNDAHLDLVLLTCEEANYVTGDIIFRQGDPGDALYLIARGEVEIVLYSSRPTDEPVIITILTPGSCFGEVTLVEEGPRTATTRCHTDVQLLRIPRNRLLRLSNDYPEIGYRIIRRIAADLALKIRENNLRTQVFMKPVTADSNN
jgi:CRP-like cAMP-binding protein